MPKILVSDEHDQAGLDLFKSHPNLEVTVKTGMKPAELKAVIGEYDALMVRSATKPDADILSAAAKLKIIVRAGEGTDNIDKKAAAAKGIVVENTPGQNSHAVAELTALKARLCAISGATPSDADLHRAMDLEDKVMAACREVMTHRRLIDVSDRVLFSVLRAREYLPPEEVLALIERLPRRAVADERPGVFISGIVPEPMSMFDLLNDSGVLVVGDDLACGSRRLYRSFGDSDPMRRLARQMLSMAPEPTISPAVAERNANLMARLAETRASGLLIYDVKFCEPEAFYVPLLEKTVRAAGLPCLHLEVELEEHIPDQIQTRINAFLEVIQ